MNFRIFSLSVMFLLLSVALATMLRADALMTTPPGTPLDWTYQMTTFPLDVDTSYTREPRRENKKEEIDPDATMAYPKEVIVERMTMGNMPPYDGQEVWFTDIGIECPWIDPDRMFYPGDMPKLAKGFSFQMRTYFLRFTIAPYEASLAETVQQFITIGQPAYIETSYFKKSLDQALFEDMAVVRALLKECDTIIDAVGWTEGQPKAMQGKNAYETQMLAILLEDLMSGYAYDMDKDFAPRIRTLGREVVPFLIRIARECENKLAKRNAIALLATATNKDIQALMLELAHGDDKVARNRALLYLARVGDTSIVPWLVKILETDRTTFSSMAATVLGRLGVVEAMPVLEKRIAEILNTNRHKRTIHDLSLLWPLMSSLVRCSLATGQDSELFLQAAEQIKLQDSFYLHPVVHMAAMGLLLNGTSATAMPRNVQVLRSQLKDPPRLLAPLQMMGVGGASFFSPRAQYLLMEILMKKPELFPPGSLIKVFKDRDCYAGLRYWIMRNWKAPDTKENKKFVREVIFETKKYNAFIRAAGLFNLYRMNNKEGIEVAEKCVKIYAKDMHRPSHMLAEGGFDAITAMTILQVENRLADSKKAIETICFKRPPILEPTFIDSSMVSGGNSHIERFIVAPVVRVALKNLGRLRDPASVSLFHKVIAKKELIGNEEAVQALGMIKHKSAAKSLLTMLDSKNSWLRFLAARSLEDIFDHEIYCDWIYGSKIDMVKAYQAWFDYVKEHSDDL